MCVQVCVCVCMCVQVCACVYSCMCVQVCACVYSCMCAHVCTRVCMCVHELALRSNCSCVCVCMRPRCDDPLLTNTVKTWWRKSSQKQWLQVNESPSTLHQLCTLAVLQKLVIATNVAHIPAREVQRSHPSRKRWHIHSIAPSPLRSVSPHVWDMTVGLTGSLTLRTADLALAQSLVPGANRRRRRPRHTTLEAVWKWKEQWRMSGCAKRC